jgi:membrane protease subunit (stomatin/prohibitin family)
MFGVSFKVIEWFDSTGQEMVHRLPESGSGEFQLGDQLRVQESQVAVIFRDGKALDVFQAGAHTLATANLPILTGLLGKMFDGKSPFRVSIVFVNMKEFIDMKWGTSEPLPFRDPDLGMVRLRAFGTYSIQISDPNLFVNKIVGSQGIFSTSEVEGYLRGILLSKVAESLGDSKLGLFDLPGNYPELSALARDSGQPDFAALGIDLKALYFVSVTPTEETAKAIDERASMGAIGNMQAYMQFKTARAIGDVASRPGGAGGGSDLTGAGLGLGAGVGFGGMMAGMMQQAMMAGQQPQQQMQQPAAAAATGAAAGAAAAAASGAACPNCKAAVPAGAKFCNNCGQKITGPMACPSCSAQVPANSKFCPECGTKF